MASRPYFYERKELLTKLVKESKPGFTKEITRKSTQRPLNNLISN